DAQLRGRVGEGDGAKVRLARDGAKARELRTDDLDGVIPAGAGVGEGLQLLDRGGLVRSHGPILPVGLPEIGRRARAAGCGIDSGIVVSGQWGKPVAHASGSF